MVVLTRRWAPGPEARLAAEVVAPLAGELIAFDISAVRVDRLPPGSERV
jgi:hypothetical protein